MSQQTNHVQPSTYIWGGLAAAILAVLWITLLLEFPYFVIPPTVVVIVFWRLRLGVRDVRGSAERRH